jgi:hypothetical protein
VRLHDLRLQSASQAFRRDFGISLALALALLRDRHGDIDLTVPVHVAAGGATSVSVWSVLRSALHHAFLNALATPLRLIGSLTRRHGEIAQVEPDPIPFHTATAKLAADAEARARDLARAMAAHPDLAVALRPVLLHAERVALGGAGGGRAPPAGTPRTPDALAAARVDAVKRLLVQRFGIPAERIDARTAPEWRTVGPPRVEVSLEARQPARG